MSGCEKDIFRDTWVRYLGYSNEVGESFRPVIPVKVVRASYGLAFAYVLADTADKSWKMFRKDGRPKKILVATGDVLLWQTFASIAIPGLVINRICNFTQNSLQRRGSIIPFTIRKFMTVAVGLMSIPIIIQPIDNGVTVLMNATYRSWVDT